MHAGHVDPRAMPFLLLGSATCSAAETALFSLTHADRLRLRKTHPGAHARIAALLSSPTGLLISILLGNTAVNSAFFVVSAVLGPRLFDGLWAVAFGIASLLAIILCGEVLQREVQRPRRVVHRDDHRDTGRRGPDRRPVLAQRRISHRAPQ